MKLCSLKSILACSIKSFHLRNENLANEQTDNKYSLLFICQYSGVIYSSHLLKGIFENFDFNQDLFDLSLILLLVSDSFFIQFIVKLLLLLSHILLILLYELLNLHLECLILSVK